MRDSFVFYKSWQKSLNRLPNGESFKKVFNAMCDSIFDDKEFSEKDFTNEELIIIDLTIPLLQAAKANYENGLKGGRPAKINYEKAMGLKEKGLNNSQIAEYFGVSKRAIEIFFQERKNEKTTEKTPKKSNDNDNDNDNDNVNENVKDTVNVNEKENLNNNNNNNNNVPSFSEIKSFCTANSLIVDPKEFYDYYNEHGWEPVYNWKSLLKKWNKNQLERQKAKDSSDPYAGLR
jgi:predicted transcriptional regulator